MTIQLANVFVVETLLTEPSKDEELGGQPRPPIRNLQDQARQLSYFALIMRLSGK